MKFSIIIPLYNKKTFILNTIKSVLNQEYKDYELLIIDDHSTDGSFDLVKSKITNTSVRLFQTKKNSGPSAARNIGLRNCNGDVVCFLDADDKYDSQYLLNLYKTYVSYGNCSIIITTRYFLSKNEVYPSLKKISSFLDLEEEGIFKVNNILKLLEKETLLGSNGTVSIKRGHISNHYFNEKESNFEDWAFFLPIVLNHKNQIYFTQNSFFYYNDLQLDNLSKREVKDIESIKIPYFLKILKQDFNENKLYKKLFTFWIYSTLSRTPFKQRLNVILKFRYEIAKYILLDQFFLKIIYKILIP